MTHSNSGLTFMRNRDHQVSRSWPRASAVAERLWSPPLSETGEDEWAAAPRMQEHECRMLARLIINIKRSFETKLLSHKKIRNNSKNLSF